VTHGPGLRPEPDQRGADDGDPPLPDPPADRVRRPPGERPREVDPRDVAEPLRWVEPERARLGVADGARVRWPERCRSRPAREVTLYLFATWSRQAMAWDSVTWPPDASSTSAARTANPGERTVPDAESCWRKCSVIVNAQRGSHVRVKQSSKMRLGEVSSSIRRREAAKDVRDRTAAAVAARSLPFSIWVPSLRRVGPSRHPAVQMAGRRQAPGGRGRPTDQGASGRLPLDEGTEKAAWANVGC
jgi:hypothetical protein